VSLLDVEWSACGIDAGEVEPHGSTVEPGQAFINRTSGLSCSENAATSSPTAICNPIHKSAFVYRWQGFRPGDCPVRLTQYHGAGKAGLRGGWRGRGVLRTGFFVAVAIPETWTKYPGSRSIGAARNVVRSATCSHVDITRTRLSVWW